MLPRTLEQEVMDTSEEASDYDAMDHVAVNASFADDFVARATSLPEGGTMLDVGSGTGRIPILIAERLPYATLVGIDLAENMLVVGRENVRRAGLSERVTLERRDAKDTGFGGGSFKAVTSNSLVHHIPQPKGALAEMWRLVAPGGILFVRDLRRPDTEEEVLDLVRLHATIPPGLPDRERAMHERQRLLFASSLRAALRLDEIEAMADAVGVRSRELYLSSDRHWTLFATKGA